MKKLVVYCLLSLCVFAAGCAHRQFPANPVYGDRLEGLMPQEMLKTTRPMITGASTKKLALVRSSNVSSALKYNAEVLEWRRWATATYVSEGQQSLLNQIAEQVSSDSLFLESLLHPLRSSFREVVIATDVVEGFERGADYVGIFDLQSSQIDRMSKYNPGPLDWDDVSKLSIVFIDRQLIAGPDIHVSVTTTTYEKPQFANANTRVALSKIQENRVATVNEFERKIREVVKR
jgi:hypothetical protein